MSVISSSGSSSRSMACLVGGGDQFVGDDLGTVCSLLAQKESSSLLASGVRFASMDRVLLDDKSISCVEMTQTNAGVVDSR